MSEAKHQLDKLHELAAKAKAGCLRSKATLMEELRPLLYKIARRADKSFTHTEDLVQEGRVAILKAINAYQPEVSHSFFAFAYPWIFHEAREYMRKNRRMISAPNTHGAKKAFNNAHRYRSNGAQREMTDAEMIAMAEDLGVTLMDVKITVDYMSSLEVSAYSEVHSESTTPVALIDTLESNEGPLEDQILQELQSRQVFTVALKQLTERELFVIQRRFLNDEGVVVQRRVLAEEKGVTQQAIEQVETRAIAKMRQVLAA